MNSKSSHRVPLAGYTNRLSARGGDTIEFRLSAQGHTRDEPASIKTWMTHSICADPNPSGPGIIEHDASAWYTPATHAAYEQIIAAGSMAVATPVDVPDNTNSIQLAATFWPTHLNGTTQCIAALGSLRLCINEHGQLSGAIDEHVISLPDAVQPKMWIRASVRVERCEDKTQLVLGCQPAPGHAMSDSESSTLTTNNHTVDSVVLHVPDSSLSSFIHQQSTPTIAACYKNKTPSWHFNGKIESPEIRFSDASSSNGNETIKRLAWDFATDMSSTHVSDIEGYGVALELLNFPARAMKCSVWAGDEMCWRHAPRQYAAIHFHDDDLVDVNWQTSFSYTLPSDIPSGVYIMHISDGQNNDAIPFFVCAPASNPGSKLCVLVSTFTYAIYGNHARPDWAPFWDEKVQAWNAYPHNPAQYPGYGLSTYNNHSDGSGICHASHLRPLFNLRPGYITFGDTTCSGLRHFQADSHLLAWLDAMNLDFDIITDRELHDEGTAAIAAYDMLLTGSHPEYHTAQTLDALQVFRDTGGHLSYLGGNGFYWRIGVHPEHPETLEIRRAEAGIRAWAAEPGEYYQAFDGQYGGLWRRNGRPPQALCGLGFSAQGQFNGSYYQRTNTDEQYAWVFDGIDEDIIGNFGLCGAGAAGFELDRADRQLGTPGNAVILASSRDHSNDFILVPEEMLTHLTTLPGPPADELLRADMIWFETPNGGSVFSVGSITFCGSLPHNNFDNNISTLLKNVVDHVLDAPA